MKIVIVIASLFCLTLNEICAQEIYEVSEIEKCIVAICKDKPDLKNILGTGFIATKDGLVVTADHVIFDEKNEKVHDKLFCLNPNYPHVRSYQVTLKKRFKTGKKGRDIAFLTIDAAKHGEIFSYLEISDDHEIGESILIVGFPLVFKKVYRWPLYRKGIIASTRYKYEKSKILILDLTSIKGFSGSPVVSLESKRVVGVFRGHPKGGKETDFSVASVLRKQDLGNSSNSD